MAFTIKDYSYYQNQSGGFTDNPYSYSAGPLSPEVLAIMRKYDNKNPYAPEAPRSFLDRTFDVLMTPLHMVAGTVNNAIDGDPSTRTWDAIGGALHAGNPFGEGYRKGETTFSDVLSTAGWKPTSTGGKVARGAVGLLADVFLDPTTYLTGGFSALVRGTGQAGLKATHTASAIARAGEELGVKATGFTNAKKIASLGESAYADTLAKFSTSKMNPSIIEGMALDNKAKMIEELSTVGKGLSFEQAKQIVKAKGIVQTSEEVTADATKMVEDYNRIAGLKTVNSDLTLSLGNAPFGKKIFGRLADPSITLMKASTIEKLGDATFGKAYSKIRDSIYGGKIGKLLFPIAPLYQASKTNPAEIYNLAKFTEFKRGLGGSASDIEKAIRDKAKMFEGMTPADTDKFMKLIQDKTIWNKVTSQVKLLDTADAKAYIDKIAENYGKNKKTYDDIVSRRASIESFKSAKEVGIKDSQKVLEQLEKEQRLALANIDVSQITDSKQLTDLIKLQKSELNGLVVKSQKALREPVVASAEVESIGKVTAPADDVSELEGIFSSVEKEFKPSETPHNSDHPIALEYEKFAQQVDDSQTFKEGIIKTHKDVIKSENLDVVYADKPMGVSKTFHQKLLDDVTKDGYTIQPTDKATSKLFEMRYSDWKKETVKKEIKVDYNGEIISKSIDEVRYTPPSVKKSSRDSLVSPKVYSALPKIEKEGFVKKLSEHLFGKPDFISPNVWDQNLHQVVEMIRDGSSKEEIRNFIMENADFYTGKAQMVYSFTAKTLGYKNWKETYTDVIQGIKRKHETSHVAEIKVLEDELKQIDPVKVKKVRAEVASKEGIIQERTHQIKELEKQVKAKTTEEGLHKQLTFVDDTLNRLKGKETLDEVSTRLLHFDEGQGAVLQGQIDDIAVASKSRSDEIQRLRKEFKSETITGDEKYKLSEKIKELNALNETEMKSSEGLHKELQVWSKDNTLNKHMVEMDELFNKSTGEAWDDVGHIKNQVDQLKQANKLDTELIKQHAETLKVIDRTPAEVSKLESKITDVKARFDERIGTDLTVAEKQQIAQLQQLALKRKNLTTTLFESTNIRKTMENIDDVALQDAMHELNGKQLEDIRNTFTNQSQPIIDKTPLARSGQTKVQASEIHFSELHKNEFIDRYLDTQHKIVKNIDSDTGASLGYTQRVKYEPKAGEVAVEGKTISTEPIKSYELKAKQDYVKAHVLPEAETLLKNMFKKNYDELSLDQQAWLTTLAKNNFLAREKGDLDKIITSFADLSKGKKESALKTVIQNRQTKAVIEAVKAEVKEGIEVSVGITVKDANGKVTMQLHAGTITDIKVGGEGDAKFTVYTLTKKDGSKVENVTAGDVTHIFPKRVVIETPVEEVVKASHITNDFAEQQALLAKSIEENEAKLAKLNKDGLDAKQAVDVEKGVKINETKNSIKLLELERASFDDAVKAGDVKEMERLEGEIAHHENLLNNEDLMDTYVRSKLGEYGVDKALKATDLNIGKIMLDTMTDVPSKVKQLVRVFREDMKKIGNEEVLAGKLKTGQFETLMNDYIYHLITDEGKALMGSKGDMESIRKKIPGFGGDSGFGMKSFNQSGLARSLHLGLEDGASVTTIKQANEFFNDLLKGKNFFSENIHEIYLTRMMNHTEMMYDHTLTQNMMSMFGKEYKGVVEKGYGAVMNYGKMKETSTSIAKLRNELVISKDVSEHLKENNIIEMLSTAVRVDPKMAGKTNLEVKIEINKLIDKYVKTYVAKTFPKEVKMKMFKDEVDTFSNGRLDDLAMPMLEFDAKQANEITSTLKGHLMEYESHIRTKLFKLEKQIHYQEFGKSMPKDIEVKTRKFLNNLNLDEFKVMLGNRAKQSDEVDALRFTNLADKIDKLKSVAPIEIKNISDGIILKTNQTRKLAIAKDQSNFLKMFDKFTHIIKLNQTAVMPAFHTRNKMSNIFLNWLGVGGDAVNINFQKQAYHTIKNKGAVTGDLKIVDASGAESSITWNELYEQAMKHDVINKGYFKDDLSVGVQTKGMIKNLPAKFDPTDTEHFFMYKKGAEIGNLIESQDRMVHFASQVSRGMSYEDAGKSVNKFLFDYSDLTAFEKNVMKRIIPYYTWLRKSTELQMRMMIETPGKYQYVAKVMCGVEGMVDREDRINKFFVNDFAQDWVQTPFTTINPEGNEEPVLWNPNLPFMDISRIPNPLQPINTLKKLFTQSNPIAKTIIEQIANYNVFFDAPIESETYNRKTKEYEKLSPTADRVDHIASQLGLYGVATGALTKSGADLGLHALNSTSGIKMLSYDYDKYKGMKIAEMAKSGNWDTRTTFDKESTSAMKSIVNALKFYQRNR